MNLRWHTHNPTDAVEEAFFRVQQERMADVPILNPRLMVAAVDFQRWQGHWLGILVTPWCMSALLVPGQSEGWESVGDNKRRFVRFPSGDYAFLGSEEAGLGEFQSCALISPMAQFGSQSEALMTARAAMIALLQAPASRTEESSTPSANTPAAPQPASDAPASPARRRFLGPFLRRAADA